MPKGFTLPQFPRLSATFPAPPLRDVVWQPLRCIKLDCIKFAFPLEKVQDGVFRGPKSEVSL